MNIATILRALCLMGTIAVAWPAPLASAQDAPLGATLRQENGFLRVQAKGREVRLESLIVRPEGVAGRLPLAIITHGRNSSSLSMGDLRATRYATLARDLARRGWLAAVVMRRGAGQSDGPLPSLTSCPAPDIAGSFGDDADDIEGALRILQARPDVDGQRVILLGESAGGATAMALIRRKPPGLRGIINVAGGLNLEGCTERGQDALVAAMTAWQGPDTVPQLWIYARNDELFPPPLVARMRKAALDAGADVRFIDLPELKPRGHIAFLHGQARHLWLREMDASLRAWGLPTLPSDRGRSFHAKLGLTTRLDAFERYFSGPGERAMALSRGKKQFRYWFGTADLETAKANALRDCGAVAPDCVIAFENDRFMLE
ncbi:MAG: alpha/beta hydrolase [Bosea sp. (in: a-proteobacteria)]|uniref:alpha/beta hydrolase family protein n=1 Tax=Bosea sp. (in: a-proteobacteria) TaxID=1871050 RepID=UPI0027356228|nr:alpha/beta fold hydrolase [Bosea sp. (in: a-proteobacteria)]MDP3258198.1 alpha/beta hydrolase [Bosea sp. (in: a-proteobacteria)]MDP3317964.1 alpha/beta hydrolase [Bosea sp. (in: a-proteobacteria)]